jgi:uncharacterized membrane protein YwaF
MKMNLPNKLTMLRILLIPVFMVVLYMGFAGSAYVALAILTVIAFFANQLIGPGANYLYMAKPESAPSVLDILPPNFALRLFVMAAVITALYALAYLPWYLMDRKAKKNAAIK